MAQQVQTFPLSTSGFLVSSGAVSWTNIKEGNANLAVGTGVLEARSFVTRNTEMFLSFDTSAIPSNAQIIDVKINLNVSLFFSRTATAFIGKVYDWTPGLTTADWVAASAMTGTESIFSDFGFNMSTGWNQIQCNSASYSDIGLGTSTAEMAVAERYQANDEASAPPSESGANFSDATLQVSWRTTPAAAISMGTNF